eukprot:TRINITY_DN4678_c1_g2_i1.p1 TRINITY_DN4678_c1_g2~~TRINITY_DN4678_c1_g2_i1.p1  ORF type:complete len:706 (+),score=276.81 TRINITY_DN4678_c1_g2_i1:107-2224(+)
MDVQHETRSRGSSVSSGVMAIARRVFTRPPIKDADRHLGPVDKFLKYGRIPVKMTLNLLIVAFMTLDLILYVPLENEYYNTSTLALSNLFCPAEQLEDNAQQSFNFYDMRDISDFMNKTYFNWDRAPDNPTALYSHTLDHQAVSHPLMHITIKSNGTFTDIIGDDDGDITMQTVTCWLSDDNPAGPFTFFLDDDARFGRGAPSPGAMKKPSTPPTVQLKQGNRSDTPENPPFCSFYDPDLFEKVNHVTIELSLDSVRVTGPSGKPTVMRWAMSQHYSMASRSGVVAFDLTFSPSIVGKFSKRYQGAIMGSGFCIIPLLCLLLALLDFLLRLKACRAEYLRHLKKKEFRNHSMQLQSYARRSSMQLEEDRPNSPKISSPKSPKQDDSGTAPACEPLLSHSSRQRADVDVLSDTPGDDMDQGMNAKLSRVLSRSRSVSMTAKREMERKTRGYSIRSQSGTGVEDDASTSIASARHYDVMQEVHEGMQDGIEWWLINDNKRQWLAISITGDLVVIASRILHIYCALTSNTVDYSTLVAKTTISGLAIMLEWIVVMSHLENQPRFYLLMKTLRRGAPKALRFTLGCFPILMGYALCGTVMFGGYADRFGTLDDSFVVLFSLMNGDIVDETFASIFFEDSLFLKVFSRMYMYSFVALFIYAILNILLVILEDAYFLVKRQVIEGIKEDMEGRDDLGAITGVDGGGVPTVQ